jgi:hypothetical protein
MRSINAIADYLGSKPFFLGAEPARVDAILSPALCGLISKVR